MTGGEGEGEERGDVVEEVLVDDMEGRVTEVGEWV